MAKLARDVMTENPACCTPQTPLEQVAKLMVQHDCGEIPVLDANDQVVGVVTGDSITACPPSSMAKAGLQAASRFPARRCRTDPTAAPA